MNRHGKLIVFESGSDASGKATQTNLLVERLASEGRKVKLIEIPNYDSEASILVRMYLRGDFGRNAFDVDPYVASTFFAQERYCEFKTNWQKFYNDEDYIIICDRYVYSNLINQASKLNKEEASKFCDWLLDFEFNIFKIPQPDCVIFLNMHVDKSLEFIKERKNKITNEDTKDIHESDEEYLRTTYNNSLELAKEYKWNVIDCIKDEQLRTVDDIHDEVYKIVSKYI